MLEGDGREEGQARVVLVGCDPIVAFGLERLLEQEAALELVEEAANEDDAVARIGDAVPDLVVVADDTPGIRRWYELIAEIRWRWPALAVLALVRDGSDRDARRAERLGVAGMVARGAPVDELRTAVRTVLAGGTFVGSDVRAMLKAAANRPPSGPLPQVPSGRPGSGPLPEVPSGRPGPGPVPQVPSGRPGSGPLPQVPSGRPGSGPLPLLAGGRPGSDPLARDATPPSTDGVDHLSLREIEILELVGLGLPPRQIAERLGISARTVHAHRENLKRKLRCASTADLDQLAVRWLLERSRTPPDPET